MHVQVKLYSGFRELLPPGARGQARLELRDATTVRELVSRLGILTSVRLITLNGQRVDDPDRPLSEGDVVQVFPPVVGG